MSGLQRNVAGQNFGFQIVTAAGVAVTAGGTGQVSKDGGAQAGLAGTLTHLGGGQWNYAPTQAETNALNVSFQFNGTSGVPIVLTFFTDAGFGIKKNTALAVFAFEMTDITNHNPLTGLTVSVSRSIDGAAFAATATATATEISNGMYYVPLAAADLNGNYIALRFTSSGADDLNIGLVTTP